MRLAPYHKRGRLEEVQVQDRRQLAHCEIRTSLLAVSTRTRMSTANGSPGFITCTVPDRTWRMRSMGWLPVRCCSLFSRCSGHFDAGDPSTEPRPFGLSLAWKRSGMDRLSSPPNQASSAPPFQVGHSSRLSLTSPSRARRAGARLSLHSGKIRKLSSNSTVLRDEMRIEY